MYVRRCFECVGDNLRCASSLRPEYSEVSLLGRSVTGVCYCYSILLVHVSGACV